MSCSYTHTYMDVQHTDGGGGMMRKGTSIASESPIVYQKQRTKPCPKLTKPESAVLQDLQIILLCTSMGSRTHVEVYICESQHLECLEYRRRGSGVQVQPQLSGEFGRQSRLQPRPYPLHFLISFKVDMYVMLSPDKIDKTFIEALSKFEERAVQNAFGKKSYLISCYSLKQHIVQEYKFFIPGAFSSCLQIMRCSLLHFNCVTYHTYIRMYKEEMCSLQNS